MLLELAGQSVFGHLSYMYWGSPDLLEGQTLPRIPSFYSDAKGCLVAYRAEVESDLVRAKDEIARFVRRHERDCALTAARNLIWKAENVPHDD